MLTGADTPSVRGSYRAAQQIKGETDSIAVSKKAEATNFRQGAVVALGRLLFAVIFVMAGANHINKQTIGYAASQGVPLASIAVPLSGVLAIAGDSAFCSAIAQNLVHGSSGCS